MAETTVVFPHLDVVHDSSEVVRFLGYAPGAVPSASVQVCVDRVVEEARRCLRPRGAYTFRSIVGRDRRTLSIGGGATLTGRVGEFMTAATRVAVFLATAGEEPARRAEAAWRDGDTLGGLVWDALGSQAAEAAVDALAADMGRHLQPGESLTPRYSPGYCGMDLKQQRTLFGLIDAAAVGVTLLPTLIMSPVKSVSGIYGIGPAPAVDEYGSPCDRCPMENCRMRR